MDQYDCNLMRMAGIDPDEEAARRKAEADHTACMDAVAAVIDQLRRQGIQQETIFAALAEWHALRPDPSQ